jgi:Ion channel
MEGIMAVLEALGGALLVLGVFLEIFEGLILPRRILRPFRFMRLYYRKFWALWKLAAGLVRVNSRRQSFLSTFGPLSLFGLFFLWAASLIVGFGLMHYSLARPETDFGESLYFSGVTFSTLGYGDVVPHPGIGRLLAVLEATTGFGFFAVVIAYLPVLYQAFSRRETLISQLDARAGSPPAAGELLVRIPPKDGGTAIVVRFLQDAEIWSAELLESHLSYPVLSFYRSQHDNQSWLATLVCTLDLSALMLTVVEGGEQLQARLTFAMARHALVDLALILHQLPEKSPRNRLSDSSLDHLFKRLRDLGVKVRDDAPARAHLAELRQLYEPFAQAMADYFALTLPDVAPEKERPDNWQNSAWMRRAAPITALGIDLRDSHFE